MELSQRVSEVFSERFGGHGTAFASAGRINLIGEHTDYNGGFVFPGAIDKVIVADIRPNGTDRVHAVSVDMDDSAEFGLTEADAPKEPEPIVRNVADLLDDLIEQSVQLVGTPVTLMTKDDKVRAIRYLNDTGAFLITKSGPKVCKYFGISKYTLYNYLDEAKSGSAATAE